MWKKWVKLFLEEKKMRLGSVRIYFVFLVKFCEFVVDYVVYKVFGFLIVLDDIVNRVSSVFVRFKGMCFSIRKEYVYVKWEK